VSQKLLTEMNKLKVRFIEPDIVGGDSVKEVERGDDNPVKSSIYFITIAVPDLFDPADPRNYFKFRDIVRPMFEKDLMRYVILRRGDDPEKVIEDIDIEVAFEVKGERTDRPNAHILLKIDHRTSLRLNYQAMRKTLNEGYGKKIHFNSQLIRNADGFEAVKKRIQGYQQKYLPSSNNDVEDKNED
jgi:hypothetical protein